MPACFFRFGALPTERGLYTDCAGVTPGQFEFDVALEYDAQLPEIADVEASDGERTRTWSDCRLRTAAPSISTTSRSFRITVLDRRWRWANSAPVILEANRPDEDGYIPTVAMQSLSELLAWLLDQMGEVDYELTDIPAEYPYVNWLGASAPQELDRLCEAYGLTLTLKTGAGNPVRIGPLSAGAELPAGGVTRRARTRRTKDFPDQVVVVGSRSRWQLKLQLEAVAYDPEDKTWKVCSPSTGNPDISYYDASAGWTFHPYAKANYKTATAEQLLQFDAAKKTLFRCYRMVEESVTLGNYDTVPVSDAQQYPVTYSREEVFREILPTLLETFATADGSNKKDSHYVYGKHATVRSFHDPKSLADSQDARVDVPYRIDKRRGLVWFSRPVFDYKTDKTLKGADLWLMCAVQGRPSIYYAPTTGGIEGAVATVRAPEIVFEYDHTDPDYQPGGDFVNQEQMIGNADTLVDLEILAREETEAPEQADYAGVIPVTLDGAIRSVTTVVSTQEAPTTTISRGAEHGQMRAPQKRFYAAASAVIRHFDLSSLTPPDDAAGAEYASD